MLHIEAALKEFGNDLVGRFVIILDEQSLVIRILARESHAQSPA